MPEEHLGRGFSLALSFVKLKTSVYNLIILLRTLLDTLARQRLPLSWQHHFGYVCSLNCMIKPLKNLNTEKTLNSYFHSISDCRSLAIEGFPLTRLRNLQTWHNLELINCLNWLSDRMIVLCTWTKFACAYSEDLKIQTVPEKFHIVSPIFEHTANVNEQPRVFKSMLPWMQMKVLCIWQFHFKMW